jgi:predicted ATPase/class 3 adenylate cyclase
VPGVCTGKSWSMGAGAAMDLPSGTVTFLFTDIEGSTRLWEQHPVAMAEALARHDSILRAAVEGHGGAIFKGAGDAICAAFPAATDAVAAALQAQLSLLPLAQHPAVPIRVRMALCTGDAERRGDDYFGPPLNRCARILSVAYGGQVLVAAVTAAVARDGLADALALKPLGEHRLRDLGAPEELHQILHADLPADFPPLRTLDAFLHNLPVETTRLIGRDDDLREVEGHLATARLLTLTGTGGTGKTRLALQAASDSLEHWPDGVWFVDLAQLSEPSFVDRAALAALGLHADPQRAARATLLDTLRPRHLLLLLDNCEHLVGACAELAGAILSSCPGVAILATSREVLRVAGEVVWRVPSLSIPGTGGLLPPQTLGQYAAVQLFVERAVAVRPDFSVTSENAPAVAQICWRLDGIPLAIELAAARLRVLSPAVVAAHLDDCFDLLTRGQRTAPARHQTLRAAVQWSHDLLTEKERALFRSLSVFAGWFTLEAAEAVGAAAGLAAHDVLDLLAELADKSLVMVRDDVDGAAYRLLETLRAYSHERLCEAGEELPAREMHAWHYLALAERETSDDPHRLTRNRRSAKHYSDFRAALEWFTAAAGGFEPGVRLARELHSYWDAVGLLDEGREHLARLLARPEAQAVTASRTHALVTAADLAAAQEDYGGARALWEQVLQARRDLHDEQGIPEALWFAGTWARSQGDHAAARSFCEQHLAWQRRRGGRAEVADALGNLAWQYHYEGDHGRAQELLAEALATLEEPDDDPRTDATRRQLLEELASVKDDHQAFLPTHEQELAAARGEGSEYAIARALVEVRWHAAQRRDWAAARQYADEHLAICRRLDDTGATASSLGWVGWIAHEQGDYERARAAYEGALATHRERGNKPKVAATLADLARTARALGDDDAARAYEEANLALLRETGDAHGLARALARLGHAAWSRGDYPEAKARFEQSLANWRKLGADRAIADCLRKLGYVAWVEKEPAEAQRLVGESLAMWDRMDDQRERSHDLNLLGLALSDQGDHQQARCVIGEALKVLRKENDEYGVADSLGHLGIVAWRDGAHREAREVQLECLRIRRQRGEKRGICLCLERLAAVQNSEGDPASAARLFGAAEAMRDGLHSPNRGDAFPEHAQVIEAIRGALGEDAFHRAWAAGRAMTLEQALDYALGDDDQA